ncbi:putative defense protein 2 [Lycorma delicatula]|uniref:putative defense protein 2 n=1 Tax=Lycorma delicatula TaxID=130591 RepID=UPI003F513761
MMTYNKIKQECLPVVTFSVIFIIYVTALPIHVNMIQNIPKFCEDLDPTEVFFLNQPIAAPQEKCPFFVRSNVSEIEIDKSVKLTLTSKPLQKFKGFILQSRYSDLLVGTFNKEPNITLFDCDQDGVYIPGFDLQKELGDTGKVNKRNTVVYNGDELIDSYSLIWEAPDYMKGRMFFYFMIYKDNNTYWMPQTTNSSYVRVTYNSSLHRIKQINVKY